MPPRRATRSTPASPSEVPEQSGSDEVQELRAQVSALVGAMQRQGEHIKSLQDLMSRQAMTAAPGSQDVPVSEALTFVPPVPPIVPPVVSGPSGSDVTALEAERARFIKVLEAFMRFNPPMFDGKEADLWVVETWLTAMEALFEDIYTLERDKVPLAAHCFEKDAQIWWQKAKKKRASNLSPLTWEEFREMLFMEYFPDSDKRKMKEDFRKLRQGNRSVREYERKFTHLVNCVPGMVHTDRDRADCFERGLRPDIFRTVNAPKLKTFEEVLDRALWVERGNAIARDERESFEREREREKEKKRTTSGAGGQSSSKRPSRYPRSQSRYPEMCDMRRKSSTDGLSTAGR
ncbi:uncharacterized protein LOC109721567 [Ananas comosus]|uniref:Uncharacterized protein LOC109721567 n=1 Tax=Ananas comosus TaxID=4615 RepID=A0A6P5GAH5_ANACO|nr:uncharacterized protein LOC109721567 [Ananas comosus]